MESRQWSKAFQDGSWDTRGLSELVKDSRSVKDGLQVVGDGESQSDWGFSSGARSRLRVGSLASGDG